MFSGFRSQWISRRSCTNLSPSRHSCARGSPNHRAQQTPRPGAQTPRQTPSHRVGSQGGDKSEDAPSGRHATHASSWVPRSPVASWSPYSTPRSPGSLLEPYSTTPSPTQRHPSNLLEPILNDPPLEPLHNAAQPYSTPLLGALTHQAATKAPTRPRSPPRSAPG